MGFVLRYCLYAMVLVGSVVTAWSGASEHMTSIRTNPLKLRMFLREMPKGGDLHNHLSGSVYAESFLKWALDADACFNPKTFAVVACSDDASLIKSEKVRSTPEVYRQIIDAWSMRNWELSGQSGHDHFFDTFGKFGPAGGGHLADMVLEATRRAADNRLSYIEFMVGFNGGGVMATARNLAWRNDYGAMRDSLLARGLRDSIRRGISILNDGEKLLTDSLKSLIDVRYLYQVLRGVPEPLAFAQILAGFEMAEMEGRVVGFNLVMPEDYPLPLEGFDAQMRMIDALRPLYKKAHISLHAGELAFGLVPPNELCCHIRNSIEIGHAERIGHGVDVAYEDNAKGLLADMAKRNVLVEICLTSNDVILGVKGNAHPFRLYSENKVPMALATDDEGVSRSDITNEYMKAVLDQNATYAELKQMAYNSIKHAFVDATTKDRLLKRLDAEFVKFEARW